MDAASRALGWATFTAMVVAVALFAAATPAGAVSRESVGTNNVYGNPTPDVVLTENHARLVKQFSVQLDNVAGGAITHVAVGGARTSLGSVERPASGTSLATDGFWASKYSRAVNSDAGHVLATSVYVLRLKVGPQRAYDPRKYADYEPGDPQDWTTSLLNIRPDRYNDADHGHWDPSTIYTDIPGGDGIFGGGSSPPVGSPLTYYDEDRGQWRPVTEYFAGDFDKPAPRKLQFTVYRPSTDAGSPSYVEFENWAAGDTVAGVRHEKNGRILVGYPGRQPEHISDVMQRVEGTGRFGGTEFAHVGQVTTNHPGAFTLSTSPYTGFSWDENVRGGLQIVPANHVKFLSYLVGQDSFIDKPQWLIVGPVGADSSALAEDVPYIVDGKLSVSPGWEAIAPLFGMYARTTFDEDAMGESTRFAVSDDHGKTWHSSPSLVGVSDPSNCSSKRCVHNWTNVRVYFSYQEGP